MSQANTYIGPLFYYFFGPKMLKATRVLHALEHDVSLGPFASFEQHQQYKILWTKKKRRKKRKINHTNVDNCGIWLSFMHVMHYHFNNEKKKEREGIWCRYLLLIYHVRTTFCVLQAKPRKTQPNAIFPKEKSFAITKLHLQMYINKLQVVIPYSNREHLSQF